LFPFIHQFASAWRWNQPTTREAILEWTNGGKLKWRLKNVCNFYVTWLRNDDDDDDDDDDDSSLLFSLRPGLYILLQKALILNTCRN
jgi:hypothetical protein